MGKLEEIEKRWESYRAKDKRGELRQTCADVFSLIEEVKRLQEERDGAIEGWEGREKAISQALDGIVKLKAEIKRLEKQRDEKDQELVAIQQWTYEKLREAEKELLDEQSGNYWGKKQIEELRAEVKRLREEIAEISEGKGRYDMDNHQHAINTIEDMKEIAKKLLEEK